MMKVDSSGNKQWAFYFGGSQGEFSRSIVQMNNGDLFLLADGYSAPEISSGSSDMYLVKVSSGGSKHFSKRFGGTNSDEARTIITDSDQHLYILGQSLTAGLSYGAFVNNLVLKTTSAGALSFGVYYGTDDAKYYANDMTISLDNKVVYIIGYTEAV
jgi:hypothetical protein